MTKKIIPSSSSESGFVFIYVVLMIALVITAISAVTVSSIKELRFSRTEQESLTAYYAADNALECIRAIVKDFDSLTTGNPIGPWNAATQFKCSGSTSSFSIGSNLGDQSTCGDPDNDEWVMNYVNTTNLTGFAPGACVDIRINYKPVQIFSGDRICRYYVETVGKSSCTDPNPIVRRRWAEI